MITKRKSSRPGFIRVVFELPAYLWADRVSVAGDFNGWDGQQTPMHQDRQGVWRVEVELPAGRRFEFRYLVDNHWLTDCHSDGVTTNPFGTQNSIVETTLPVKSLADERGSTYPVPVFVQKGLPATVMDCEKLRL